MTSSNWNIFRVTDTLWGELPVNSPSQRPVTRSFEVFFDQHLNKGLSKPSRRRWFKTPSRSLWRHCNGPSSICHAVTSGHDIERVRWIFFSHLPLNGERENTVKIHIYFLITNQHLTHRDQVTRVCVAKLTIIQSDNGLSPGRRQAFIWTIAGILLIGPLGTNFSEIVIESPTLSWKKNTFKVSSAKCCPLRLGLNMLNG